MEQTNQPTNVDSTVGLGVMLAAETTDHYIERKLRDAREAARKKWGRCTAYRTGRMLGEAGVQVFGCPYGSIKAQRNFEAGIADGLAARARPLALESGRDA